MTTFPPGGYEYGETRRRYIEPYGSAVVMNTYLQMAVCALSLVAIALMALTWHAHRALRQVKPLVIRIDDVGRAAAVDDASLAYPPQAPELRHFLIQFVVKHYSRTGRTVRQQYAEALYSLDGRLADATIDANKKSGVIERFLTGTSEDIDIHIRNVALDDLRQPPYHATIEFEKVFLSPATLAQVRREIFVAQVVFVLRDQVDNARIPINPLGLTITYFREDQAFVAEGPGRS